MMFSKFNISTQRGDKVVLFNTLTSSIVELNISDFNSILTDKGNTTLQGKLREMGFIVENHEEECQKFKYIQYSRMFRNDHLSLYICPTLDCNFSCAYCFEGQNKEKASMTEEVEDSIVQYLVKNKNKNISIVWFGGEPLLRIDTIKAIAEKLEINKVDYTSSIITNGSLLTTSAVKLLKILPVEFIQISIDGSKDVHDKRRCFKSGKGSYDVIMSGIERLIYDTSIMITIQVTVDKTNKDEYVNLLSYFNDRYPNEMKIGRIRVSYNIVKDRTNFDSGSTCMNHHEYFDFLVDLNNNSIEHKEQLYLPDICHPCMFNTRDSYAISPNGDMYKCIEHLGDKFKSVGNIVNKSISFNKLSSCFFKNNYLDNEECMECPVMPVCGGGCPTDREKDNGNNSIACSFYKKYLDKILSTIEL